MDDPGDRTPPHTPPAGPDVRIEAANFGPIEHAAVDLRPLTVFVGPSNTGKTYFAVLIYALYRILGGFRRLPAPFHRGYQRALFPDRRPADDGMLRPGELRDLLDKLEADATSFSLSDVPERARDAVRTCLLDPETLRAGLEWELVRCFDVESASELVRLPGRWTEMRISLAVREKGRDLWGLRAGVSESGVIADGRLEEDVAFFPEEGPDSTFARRIRSLSGRLSADAGSRGRSAAEYIARYNAGNRGYPIEAFVEELFFAAFRSGGAPDGDAYYLPAARSGIMESHRVIASSLVARSTRAGLERFPELPTFSGVMADFMQRLILYEEDESDDRSMNELAAKLEQETLAGRIGIRRPTPGGYPEFVYRPRGTKREVRLTRASSMVSELAPVVLFLRGPVGRGDTLVIEEPEAHLHPAAQTRVAVALARLVRAGVRVVVTTHSDWLLKEIGNLMRAGALDEAGRPAADDSPPSALRRGEVGIWLFNQGGSASGATVEEIPFDSIEGVEPPDYEEVDEALYNRSADLQNRIEDVAKGAGREPG